MPTEVTRRRFLGQTLGVIGGATVSGELLPLLAEAAKRKHILRVAIERDFETLRPELSAGDTANLLRRLIYTTPILWGTKQRADGSLIYDPDSIEMVLATAYKVSEDRQQIEFTLRDKAKFANGDALNAQALKESYAWFLGARGSGQLKVNGVPSVDHIEVVDEVTVRLHLDRPVAWGLIGNALLSSSSIIHAREVLKHATADDPYGARWLETRTVESGPFVIENWQKGSMMSLVPHPHALQKPTLERIILQVVPDASTRRIVLERGDVDFAVQIAPKDIYETDLAKARQELAQAKIPEGFSVTVPVYAGDLFDEEATVLIKESLAQLGIKLTLQKMPISQKRSLMTQKQVDMAVYDWRPWVPDAGYFIYWNWLPDSFTNYWSYTNPEAQTLGDETITMAVDSPERQAKLRRFQEIVNGEIGLVPLFTQFDNIVMRENVQGYVYYPDTVPVLAKMRIE